MCVCVCVCYFSHFPCSQPFLLLLRQSLIWRTRITHKYITMADVVEPQKTEEELEAEVAALMAGTKKKKKDKKEKKKDKGEKKDKKKKDKKKKKKGSDEDDDALPAGVDGESKADEGDAAAAAASGESNVYSSAAKETYQYQLLLTRVYEILKRNNPEYAVKKRYVMAPPQVYRVGSTRTCWANFATICGQMNRAPDHVLSFFLVRGACPCLSSWTQ